MAYNTNMYNPYYTQPLQQTNGLVKVTGIDGAQIYPLAPNSISPPLFLENENAFFVKTTDGCGASTIKKYKFEECELISTDNNNYVTKDDFSKFEQRIMEAINGKHTVPESASSE